MKTTITFNIAAISPQGKVFLNILRSQSARFHYALTPDDSGNITAVIADDEATSDAVKVSVVNSNGEFLDWSVPVGIPYLYKQERLDGAEAWNTIAAAFNKWRKDNHVRPGTPPWVIEPSNAPAPATMWRDLYIEGHFM